MFVKFKKNVSYFYNRTNTIIKNKQNYKYSYLKTQLRCLCSPSNIQCKENLKTFEDFVAERRSEARRSFIVQVFSEQSCWDLFDYCNSIMPVKFMQHYSPNNNDNFVIAELATDNIYEFLSKCRHLEDAEALPVKSPFVWFKTSQNRLKKKSKTTDTFPSHSMLGNSELIELLSNSSSMSEQMRILYESTRLDEVGIRLRFITARQVEIALLGLFPECSVLPFGSSVNGFGKVGCDLDLGLRYSTSSVHKDSRLVFQSKEGGHNGRAHVQRQMEMLADVLHVFLPGCSNVRRILKARVPIVKYSHDYTGLECDLSVTDLTGVYMSEMLWLYGSLDDRVRPLVFTVRRWAQSVGLTSPTPGKSISNFSLSALVIFYLQTVKILPHFLQLVKMARPEDTRVAGEINCTFVRNISLIPESNIDVDSGSLLTGFFDYFANFDYDRFGICLRSGKPISKPDHSPLYLVNPLEPSLNVSRNLSLEELTRLRIECRNASWLLQSSSSIINLFKSLNINNPKTVTKTGKRLVTVKHLFKNQDIG